MLLVVNPNDANALQIANAYAALRNIPAKNIEFIDPPADYQNNGYPTPITQAEVSNYYLNPIRSYISNQGLANQINYIGTIGEATSYATTPISGSRTPATTANSLNYALDLLTPLTNGSGLTLQNAMYETYPSGLPSYAGPISGLYDSTPGSIPVGNNSAIAHAATYSVNYMGTNIATQYYMSGTVGYTGGAGNTAAQVIASLKSAAASDGTHPTGTVYFENNSDVRSTTRQGEWPATVTQLNARGIATVQESNTVGATPLNRNDVLGAVTGLATLSLPNGSTYLPGSWADNLTSYGCDFLDSSQTKATAFITAGAAGTTGSVVEPYALSDRFTNSSIYTFIADGSTFGEALAKSVAAPDIQMPLGDMLAQPFADIPKVTITSGPGNYRPVAGSISISGSAGLVNPKIASGISRLALLVDGLVSSSGTVAGGAGTFNVNTSGLSDGVHEIRIVAINNAQAASEGSAAQEIIVNNRGRLISYLSGNLTLRSSAASISLATTTGGSTVSQTELTCLGRVVAQASGAVSALSLSPTALAPGDNVIVPVAVFSDGSQVAGGAFVAHVGIGTVNGWSNGVGSGMWSNSPNWTGGVLPQNGDGVARFGGSANNGNVTLDASASIEEIDFDGSGGGSYTISATPGQRLTLSSTNGTASECLVNVLSGTHTISAPLVLAAAGNLVSVTSLADCLTIDGGISGVGALTKTGAGTLVLAGGNTYSGMTTITAGTLVLAGSNNYAGMMTISAGTLQVGTGGAGGTLGPGSIFDNSVLLLTHSDTITLTNSIGGNGSVSQSGPGTAILTASNSYSGGTQITGGNLVFSSTNSIPGSGTILLNAPGALNVTGAYSSVAGWLGSGKIDNNSTGVLALSGTNSENIGMDSYGGLALGAADPGATYSGVLTPSGSSFLLGGGGGTLTVTSNLTGNRSLAVGSMGVGTVILGGSNTYSGGTTVFSGTLSVATPAALPDGGVLIVGADATSIFGLSAASSLTAIAENLEVLMSGGVASPNDSLTTSLSTLDSRPPPSETSPANPVPEPGTLLLLLSAAGGSLLLRARRRT